MIKGSSKFKIISDHLGSPRLIVDVETRSIAQRIEYDEFGRVVSDTRPGFQPLGFAGGIYDQDTKLIRFGARDYDPETGRWTNRDSLLFAGSAANLYGYCGQDAVNCIDPSGRFWQLAAGAAIGAFTAYQNYDAGVKAHGSAAQVVTSAAAGFVVGFVAGAALSTNPLSSGAVLATAAAANNAINQKLYNGQMGDVSSVAQSAAVGFVSGFAGAALALGASEVFYLSELGAGAFGVPTSILGFNGPNGIPDGPGRGQSACQ